MFFIFLIFFREIFGLNENHGIFVSNILGGMKSSDDGKFGLAQPRFNTSCDESSMNAALECEGGLLFKYKLTIKDNKFFEIISYSLALRGSFGDVKTKRLTVLCIEYCVRFWLKRAKFNF